MKIKNKLRMKTENVLGVMRSDKEDQVYGIDLQFEHYQYSINDHNFRHY